MAASPVSMDLFDRRILFELDCDSRRPLSDIARKVRLGRDLVSYRLDRLRTAGILNRCTAMLNPYKLGFTVYKTYLKLEASKGRWNEFVSYLDQSPYTAWLAECYGKWDVIWSVYARTPKEVYDLQDRLFSDFRDIILAYNVCTLVNHWRFPKKYLISQSPGEVREWAFHLPEFTFGATPMEHNLDETEYKLVQLLSHNAQMSCVELAKAADTTPAVVKYRIEKLEELGVINGYRVDIDPAVLGMTLFRVQVFPREYDAAKEAEFHNYCQSHPLIASYEQQLGDCKLEFEVEAHDYAQFSAVIDEVRERFSKYLRTVEYMMVRKDYQHRTPCNVFVHHQAQREARAPQAAHPALNVTWPASPAAPAA